MNCHYLPDHDRQSWTQLHMVMDDPEGLGVDECEPVDESSDFIAPLVQGEEPAALHICIVQSPVFNTL